MHRHGEVVITAARRRPHELMPSPRDMEVHKYGEHIRAQIPRRTLEVIGSTGLSPFKFEREAGVTREMLSKTLKGKSIPGPCVIAQISYAGGITLTEFVRGLEYPPGQDPRDDLYAYGA